MNKIIPALALLTILDLRPACISILKAFRPAAILFFLLFAFQPADAQQLIKVTEGKLTYRPVVKNNRILWFETREVNRSIGRVSLYVYENGNNKLITNDASALFPGWPDMDDNGNVAYMKNMGTSHEVFLYDGFTFKETRITNNPAIRNSTIDMGLGTDKVYTGFVRIHDGEIVFKNKLGHIYLYQPKTKSIRSITTDPAQTANLGDDDPGKASTGIAAPGNAHVKYFEFDGSHIVWMHEERGNSTNSKVSIYMAKAEDSFSPKLITSFDAWVPNDKALVPGKLWNPFFRACNGTIIWQYYLPSQLPKLPAGAIIPNLIKDYGANLDDARVGFYDGAVKEISSGTAVTFQSVRISEGKAAWSQIRKEREREGKKVNAFGEVIVYGAGAKQVVASYPEPSAQGKLRELFWDGVLDVEIVGEDVFWAMRQVECFQQFRMPITNQSYCMFKPTTNIGFFRRSFGTSNPFRQIDSQTFAGGGELDRGLYAFFSNRGPTVRDISALNIYGEGDDQSSTNLLTIIDRKKPDLKKWRVDETNRKQISDAFSISYDSIAACGETAGAGEVTLESVTLDVAVEKSPTARFEDIQSVALYSDENGDGKLDTADKLLGRRNSPVSAEVIFTFSGTGIKIKKNEPKYFLVEMEIKDEVCPCGKYTVSINGEKLGVKKAPGGSTTATGKTIGGFIMPEAVVKSFSGDEQSGVPNQLLPERLVVTFKNFPVRCGRAKFKITTQPPEKGAVIFTTGNQPSTDELIFDLTQVGKDARSEVVFRFGSQDGFYTVQASIVMAGGMACPNIDKIFRLHAGKMVVSLIDMNNPDFFAATPDDSNPDYSTWKATMTGDAEKLSLGGEGRDGALADGLSMLLIRAKLVGFTDPPPGNINLTISGDQNLGHLTKGLGEAIPAYGGGNAVSVQWVTTRTGVYAFALYTPPENFGYTTAPRRKVHLKASYKLPESTQPLVTEQDLILSKPPIAFVHGLWSGPETWGRPYQLHANQYDVYYIDYSDLSSRSFTELGTELKIGIEDIVRRQRQLGLAATRVNVVGHSMGGLVARQHFADDHGRRFFRKDNFGKGDIYKLVTLGTPHFGSPIAWLAVTMRDQRYNPFLVVANELGLDVNGGAIDALCPGSRDLQGLGKTRIPTHTMLAWNFDSQTDALSWEDFIESLGLNLRKIFADPKPGVSSAKNFNPMALLSFMIKYSAKAGVKISLASLYGSDKTDMLVTLESQTGGVAQGRNKIFAKTIHFDTGDDYSPLLYSETTSEPIADRIFDVLNHDYGDLSIFAPELPAPQVSDPTTVCRPRR